MASLEREGFLDDPTYIQGLAKDDPLLRNENVFVFSANVASFEVLQLLQMVIAPLGISDPGEQMYHFVPAIFDPPVFDVCKSSCHYPKLMAKGDRSGVTVTSRSEIAEKSRNMLRKRPPHKQVIDAILKAL